MTPSRSAIQTRLPILGKIDVDKIKLNIMTEISTTFFLFISTPSVHRVKSND